MISLDAVTFVGHELNRPECVLAHSSGLLFAPCWQGNGGVSILTPEGRVRHLLAIDPPESLKPNGIALEDGGSFLLAHLGAERGAIFRLFADGRVEIVCDTVEGAPMPPANFVTQDRNGGIWFTVSTRVTPRADDYRPTANSGFIAKIVGGEAQIMADGLGYTNELVFTENGRTLWVNETFAQRTTAFDLDEGSCLHNRRSIAEYGPGTFPDGIALDESGSLWITSIVSNRVLRIDAGGNVTTMLEDSEPDHIARTDAAFHAGSMGRPHLDRAVSKRLKNISNLAFGGPDLRMAYLGCLLGDRIATFEAPVPGLAPVHWQFGLGVLR